MMLFRVECDGVDEYQPQTIVTATGSYGKYLDGLSSDNPNYYKAHLEQGLTKARGMPLRRCCLFLFGELKDALIFSSKMFDGNACIYTTNVDVNDVVYKGDMNVLDTLKEAIKLDIHKNYPDTFAGFCSHYWKNGYTFSPCYEYIVRQAEIKELICDRDTCRKFHNEYAADHSVERSSIYRQKLHEVY